MKACRDKILIKTSIDREKSSNLQNQKEKCEFDLKLIKNFDQFSDSEEREVKERAEKRLAEQREKAEDLKAKKRKLKSEENKIKEGEM